MYDEIAELYLEIFPLNQAFLNFIPEFLGSPGNSAIDLGCGSGDYVDALTRAGYRVTGIDSSPGMIAQARANKQGTFHELSFTEIDQLSGSFECVYCVGNSLSYLPEGAMPDFMKNIQQLLTPGGNLVIQVVNWDKYRQTGAADFPVQPLSEERTFHRRYESIDTVQVIFHTEIRKGSAILGAWAAPLYPKYQKALMAHLQSAGLSITGILGDYLKTPFDPIVSPALILTARKSK